MKWICLVVAMFLVGCDNSNALLWDQAAIAREKANPIIIDGKYLDVIQVGGHQYVTNSKAILHYEGCPNH